MAPSKNIQIAPKKSPVPPNVGQKILPATLPVPGKSGK